MNLELNEFLFYLKFTFLFFFTRYAARESDVSNGNNGVVSKANCEWKEIGQDLFIFPSHNVESRTKIAGFDVGECFWFKII